MDFSIRKELSLKAAQRAQFVRIKCDISETDVVDPVSISEQLGCEVRFKSLPSLEGVYSPTPISVIVLGSQRYAGRRSYTCAHELGHHEFNHGLRLEELKNSSSESNNYNDPDEFLADMFAAFLLMPKLCVLKLFKERKIKINEVTPLQIFKLSSYLGVGYSTLINHMSWTLKLITPQHKKHLLQVKPKQIKASFGCPPQAETVIVDEFWKNRTIDLEKEDILVLPEEVFLENQMKIVPIGTVNEFKTYKAISKGYSRALNGQWATNIRITSRFYEGLSSNRFLDDPEENI